MGLVWLEWTRFVENRQQPQFVKMDVTTMMSLTGLSTIFLKSHVWHYGRYHFGFS